MDWLELHNRYYKLARYVAVRHARTREDSDDLFQEACIAMHDALPYLEKQKNPDAYIKTVICNRIMRRVTKQRMGWNSHAEEMPLEVFPGRDYLGQAEASMELEMLSSKLTGGAKEIFETKVDLWMGEKRISTKAVAQRRGIQRSKCANEIRQLEASI
jgi:RNA polymerase sigma factor (sigma-70 family)